MSHPQGKCPVCDKSFQPGDDVVICPVCGAPYHRACYQQAGQCVFADQHHTGFEYRPPQPQQPEATAQPEAADGQPPQAEAPDTATEEKDMLCPNCNTVNDGGAIFCSNCGTPLHADPTGGARWNGYGGQATGGYGGYTGYGSFVPPLDMNGEIDGIPKRDWAEYIGRSANVYLQRMDNMEKRGSKISMMISAFLVSPYYFAYRKLWGWSIFALGIFLLLMLPQIFLAMAEAGASPFPGLSLDTLSIITIVANYLSLGARIVFGLFAMHLYRKEAGRKIKLLREQFSDEQAYHDAIAKKGGVSMAGTIAVLALSAVFYFALIVALGDGLIAALYPMLA